MDASGGAARRHVGEGGSGPVLKLRRASGEAVDWVTASFLGADAPAEVACERPDACMPVPPVVATPASSAPGGVKPLPVRCAKASAVTIGVEVTGRVCLEVRVGGGMKVAQVLQELEDAEKWLHTSAHDAAMTPVAGRVDLSQPVRKRVVLEDGAGVSAGVLARAGVDVRVEAGR